MAAAFLAWASGSSRAHGRRRGGGGGASRSEGEGGGAAAEFATGWQRWRRRRGRKNDDRGGGGGEEEFGAAPTGATTRLRCLAASFMASLSLSLSKLLRTQAAREFARFAEFSFSLFVFSLFVSVGNMTPLRHREASKKKKKKKKKSRGTFRKGKVLAFPPLAPLSGAH